VLPKYNYLVKQARKKNTNVFYRKEGCILPFVLEISALQSLQLVEYYCLSEMLLLCKKNGKVILISHSELLLSLTCPFVSL
jgi:hypothetical protein